MKRDDVMKKKDDVTAAYQAGIDAADRVMDKLEPLLRAWPVMNEEEKREMMNHLMGRTTRPKRA